MSATDMSAPGHAQRLRDELVRATADAGRARDEYEALLADPDVIQEDRDAAASLAEYSRRQLDLAQAAIAQLEAGTYGRCATCGTDIGDERLTALIDVTTCVNCAG